MLQIMVLDDRAIHRRGSESPGIANPLISIDWLLRKKKQTSSLLPACDTSTTVFRTEGFAVIAFVFSMHRTVTLPKVFVPLLGK